MDESKVQEEKDPVGDKMVEYLVLEAEVGFSGVVAIKRPNLPILYRSFGYSNKEREQLNTKETVFDIGSLTKQFTAAAILKLEMQGKLAVTDSVVKYLPTIPEAKKGITIHQLLTHTSGLPRRLGSDLERLNKDEFIFRTFQSDLSFEPGTAYNYSHVGYSLLGVLIEKISGLSYEMYLKKNLFDPVGMKQTGYVLPNWDLSKVANGYSRCRNFGKPMDLPWDAQGPFWNLKANAGILSTAVDLMAWSDAINNNTVLSKEATDKYLKKHVKEDDSNSYYAYGWSIAESVRGTYAFRHEGGNHVFYSDWLNYPIEKVSILLLSNESRRGNSNITYELATTLFHPNHESAVQGVSTQCLDSLPDNRLGEVAGEFLKMMATGKLELVNEYINTYVGKYMLDKYPRDTIVTVLSKWQNEVGLTNIRQVRIIDNSILELRISRASDSKNFFFRLYLDEDDNYRLKTIMYSSTKR